MISMSLKTQVFETYRVSERVVLCVGDKFTVKGGPYWKASDGTKVRLSSPGPFTFHRYCKRGSVEWIEAVDKNGAFAPLHIAGRRRRIDERLVARPYSVSRKKRRPPPSAKA